MGRARPYVGFAAAAFNDSQVVYPPRPVSANGSGPGSPPDAKIASRPRKCGQPTRMLAGFRRRKVVMDQSDRVPSRSPDSSNVTRLAPGGSNRVAQLTPAHHQPPRPFDLDELATNEDTIDVHLEAAAGNCLQQRPLTHPLHHHLGNDEAVEHCLRHRIDEDRGRIGHRWSTAFLARLGGGLELLHAFWPELFEKCRDRLETVGAHGIEMARSDLPELQQPGVAKQRQVLADRLLGACRNAWRCRRPTTALAAPVAGCGDVSDRLLP